MVSYKLPAPIALRVAMARERGHDPASQGCAMFRCTICNVQGFLDTDDSPLMGASCIGQPTSQQPTPKRRRPRASYVIRMLTPDATVCAPHIAYVRDQNPGSFWPYTDRLDRAQHWNTRTKAQRWIDAQPTALRARYTIERLGKRTEK